MPARGLLRSRYDAGYWDDAAVWFVGYSGGKVAEGNRSAGDFGEPLIVRRSAFGRRMDLVVPVGDSRDEEGNRSGEKLDRRAGASRRARRAGLDTEKPGNGTGFESEARETLLTRNFSFHQLSTGAEPRSFKQFGKLFFPRAPARL